MMLSEMKTEVRNNIRRDTSVFSDDLIDRMLNWSQERIGDMHTFEEMKKLFSASVVSGQLRYSFPTRMKDLKTIRIMDGSSSRKLHYVHERDIDRARPYPDDYSGMPGYYVDYGDFFELHDIPDSSTYTLLLRCSRYAADLSSDSQTSDLLRKDLVLIAGATALAFLWIKEVEDANVWDSIFNVLMKDKVRTDHSGEDWEPQGQPFSVVVGGIDPNKPMNSFMR